MCEMDDGECPTVWSDSKVKAAKKAHRCNSCGRTIQPGESYGKNFCVFDGHAASEKACAECDSARLEFGHAEGHLTPTPSSFEEMLSSCVDDGDDGAWTAMLDGLRKRRGAAYVARAELRKRPVIVVDDASLESANADAPERAVRVDAARAAIVNAVHTDAGIPLRQAPATEDPHVITRRDAHGRRYLAEDGSWGELSKAKRWPTKRAACEAKPYRAVVWSLTGLAHLLGKDAAGEAKKKQAQTTTSAPTMAADPVLAREDDGGGA